jgi:hypothetical protein
MEYRSLRHIVGVPTDSSKCRGLQAIFAAAICLELMATKVAEAARMNQSPIQMRR